MLSYYAREIVLSNLSLYRTAKNLGLGECITTISSDSRSFRKAMFGVCPDIVKKLVPGTHTRRNIKTITVIAPDDIRDKYNEIRALLNNTGLHSNSILQAVPITCYDFRNIALLPTSQLVSDGYYSVGMRSLPSGNLAMYLYFDNNSHDPIAAIHGYVRFVEGVRIWHDTISKYGINTIVHIAKFMSAWPRASADNRSLYDMNNNARYNISSQIMSRRTTCEKALNNLRGSDCYTTMLTERTKRYDAIIRERRRLRHTFDALSSSNIYLMMYMYGMINVLPVTLLVHDQVLGRWYPVTVPVQADKASSACQFAQVVNNDVILCDSNLEIDRDVANSDLVNVLAKISEGF